jgi:1,4-alpha-glucan branching enzyme
MKNFSLFLVLFVLLSGLLPAFAQISTKSVCELRDGNIIFKIDMRWSKNELEKVSKMFDLDTALLSDALKGERLIFADSILWQTKKLRNNIIELSKIMQAPSLTIQNRNEFLVHNNFDQNLLYRSFYPDAPFGSNSFKRKSAFSIHEGKARFFLASNLKAKSVFLSGSFNQWSTMKTLMTKTDSGWVTDVDLKPGMYLYKYIIDGRWLVDPSNKLKETDEYGGNNSIVFSPNHTFILNGKTEAKRTVLTGSFTDWDPRGIEMEKTAKGWQLPVYLGDGTYTYKFIVDHEWMLDPSNPDQKPDGRGNVNSVIAKGEDYLFRLNAYTNARKVYLAGSFNDWAPGELLMQKVAGGWELPYKLAAGRYEYKFIVDGQWMPDPENQCTTGFDELTNSVLMVKPNYTFVLNQFEHAQRVIVTGSFNGWDVNSYRMQKVGKTWVFPISLRPGKYTYKFIVDGTWMLDPANSLWEENEYDTGNSVLWISQ